MGQASAVQSHDLGNASCACRRLQAKTNSAATARALTKRDFQQLAVHWGLSDSSPDFWAKHSAEDDLLLALYEHAKSALDPVET